MKNEMDYTGAFAKLEELVAQLEEGDIQLEDLAAKISQGIAALLQNSAPDNA